MGFVRIRLIWTISYGVTENSLSIRREPVKNDASEFGILLIAKLGSHLNPFNIKIKNT